MALTHDPAYSTPSSNPNLKEKFRDSKKEKFQENVEYMDAIVGRIVKSLEDSGLRDDTIIIFVGDNGTGGEGKATPTELGARVPMIVNCPGRVKATGPSKALVDTSDVMPTLVELCSASLPENHPIDGRSFVPLLNGEKSDTRDWIFSYLSDNRILRTKRYLLERNTPYRFGTLYDCGESRDGTGYRDVTDSTEAEVLKVKEYFLGILETKPTPILTEAEKKQQLERERQRAARG
jgi:arylsulfatase A